MRRIAAVLAAMLLSIGLVLGMAATATASDWKWVAGNTVSGHDPYVTVTKNKIRHPNKIRFVVTAKNTRKLTLSWYVDCQRGGRFDSKSATVKAYPTIKKAVTLPVRNPNRCYAEASVYQTKSFKYNRITVKIQKTT